MKSRDLVRMARQRTGFTQAELAARSGIPRETIARWEAGSREPSLESLRRLIRATGLDLTLGLVVADESLNELVREQLQASPKQRLGRLLPPADLARSVEALSWLAGSAGEAIVIGPVAAALQGAPQRPGDGSVEVVPADLMMLAGELAAGGYEPLDSPERWADSDRRWPWRRADTIITLASGLPGAPGGYKDLRRSAQAVSLDGGLDIQVADPRDLLRVAEASMREEERTRIPGLRALLEELGATRS